MSAKGTQSDNVLSEGPRLDEYRVRFLKTHNGIELDIREYVDAENFKGFTRRGVRLNPAMLKELAWFIQKDLPRLMGQGNAVPAPAPVVVPPSKPVPMPHVHSAASLIDDIINATTASTPAAPVAPAPKPAPKPVPAPKAPSKPVPSPIKAQRDALAQSMAIPAGDLAALRERMRKGEKVPVSDIVAALEREKARRVS